MPWSKKERRITKKKYKPQKKWLSKLKPTNLHTYFGLAINRTPSWTRFHSTEQVFPEPSNHTSATASREAREHDFATSFTRPRPSNFLSSMFYLRRSCSLRVASQNLKLNQVGLVGTLLTNYKPFWRVSNHDLFLFPISSTLKSWT